ncbi:hypothetical protein BDZ90DRAFT_232614 [Jaminaea rosea]|uniref:Uncharacterized protein n=1 Tax=Jaminaea rosea TaxID=1569628 RepID=A0A316UP52_9BASI|nr:hypothetical protein BDZ90DRAFT_232614 [Jaminaea rosea]PWN27050.1 hypothetical protein BDZ90DRAFT_232614 [Jaminaea rosea]
MTSRFGGRFVSSNAANPSKEPVPIWEQSWVLPAPNARIKVLKWVKRTDLPGRTFPEEEDAGVIYEKEQQRLKRQRLEEAGGGEEQAAKVAEPAKDVAAPATVVEAGGSAGGQDVTMTDAPPAPAAPSASQEAVATSAAAEGGDALSAGVTADETQGQHLFDETQAAPIGGGGLQDDADETMDAGSKILPTATATADATPAGAITPAVAEGAGKAEDDDEGEGGEEEEEDEEEGEEEKAKQVVDKRATIRIGGPLPAGVEEEPIVEAPAKPQGEVEATAAAGEEGKDTQADQAVAAAEEVPIAAPPAESTSTEEQPAPHVEAELNPSAPPPPSDAPALDAPQDVEGDALGGVETTTRADPEVKQAEQAAQGEGGEVAAVVHSMPGGGERVKVVVSEEEKKAEEAQEQGEPQA